MKTILSLLIMGMTLGGVTGVHSQVDSAVLLNIAIRAQEQISGQISGSSDEIKRLFEEGRQKIDALERAVENNDVESAERNFHLALEIFAEISRQLETDVEDMNPSGDLQRLEAYVENLRMIAGNHNALIDFTGIDELFAKAWQQIGSGQSNQAAQIIHQIKELATEINSRLSEDASEQESLRIQEYARQYLDRLDVLIENARDRGADIQIEELEADLADAWRTFEEIRTYLAGGEFDAANELLRDLAKQMRDIENSL